MKTLASFATPATVSNFVSSAAAIPSQVVELADLRSYAFTYMLRGSVVLVAALSEVMLEIGGFAAPWLPWMVLMPLMAIVLSVRSRRERKLRPASTALAAKTMRLLQKSFVVIMLIAIICAMQFGWVNAHPILLLFNGLAAVVAGRVLSFRPLVLGGISSVVLGVAIIFMPAHIQLIVIAAAMLVSYVVPGYLLNAQGRVAA
ncbi:hypothetical protein SAMN00120144_1382 [Hymenobacter roseosalivarius DSM 11622]|uniref:Transmembrane protein n=1 Tax=Hymenobacter roseosalivarius DSM 11622 TaxID=645990 RepID=A0A1W1V2W2_9BACT|nr:hypothetical protein [Hymenobacter roseosalivarius]SMB87638.1 hypothetical protein SAMN00120144_1382 [Hymenobacter roseosalivarius DSM 11622]